MKPDFSTESLTGVWRTTVEHFMASPEGQNLVDRISSCTADVFPPHPFRALEETPFEQVRAVIFGRIRITRPVRLVG